MEPTNRLVGIVVGVLRWALPWVFVLALSTGVAYAMNTAAVRAVSTNGRTDVVSAGVRDVRNVCAQDVDRALYDRLDRWLPAGRSEFCRAETYSGEPGPYESARQLSYAGPLQATITFVGPNNVRIDLYCLTSSQQRSADADFVSAAEARHLYDLVCTQAGG